MPEPAATVALCPDITGPGDHYCCDCFAFNNMPCCNPHHDEAMTSLPEWADAWRASKCGVCGNRLVLVFDMTGQSHVVCSWTGKTECDNGADLRKQEAWDDAAAEQRMEGPYRG